MQLRPYQIEMRQQIAAAWPTAKAVMAVLPTGSGKTVLFSSELADHHGSSVAIAHRQELVGQMSLALARYGVKHRIIAPTNVVRGIIQQHIAELGKDFYNPSAQCAVAGVDTIISWAKETSPQYHAFTRWAANVTYAVCDEGHHCLVTNKWGKALTLFPHARILLVTATPERADGKGLGRHADGIVDVMIEGPGMRQLINGLPDHRGIITPFLTDYRIACPPSDLDLSTVGLGADGDYVRGQLAKKTRGSTIMGHVVEHYLRMASGKLGVTFAPDVETSVEFARLFNQAGVRAEAVSAKTPDHVRREIIRRFRNREVMQLINCDLFGEGFDLPAIEVVSMARATQSYSLYCQQFGRALRLMEGKEKALIIDHVGNVAQHLLPDRIGKEWTLDRRDRAAKKEKDPNAIPMRICCNPVCMSPFERILDNCPFCGWTPVPAGRATIEQVDGCLYELDAAALAAMRGEVAKVDEHPDAVRAWMQRAGHPPVVCNSAALRHKEKQEAQAALRSGMELYGGIQAFIGLSDKEAQRKFYHQFGIDVLGAQALGRADAEILTEKVNRVIGRV